MAILYMSSFDYSDSLSDFDLVQTSGGGSGHTVDTTTKRTGRASMKFMPSTYFGPSEFTWFSSSQETTIWAQAAYRADGYPQVDVTEPGGGGGKIFSFMEGTTLHVGIGFSKSTRAIEVARDLTVIATSSAVDLLPLGQWIFLEAKVTISDTVGTALVKVNGFTVVDASGLDTKNGGTGYVDRVRMASQGSQYSSCWFDDLMVGNASGSVNTSPPGDSRVEFLSPNAAGSITQFTPSTGVNYQNVDEVPASDTDYNYSTEIGATDVFGLSALGGNGVIHGVQSVLRTRKDDAGARTIRPAFYKAIGAGDTPRLYGGTPQSAPDSFGYKRVIIESSPDTGTTWGVDEINDIQFGYMIGGGGHMSLDAWIEEA